MTKYKLFELPQRYFKGNVVFEAENQSAKPRNCRVPTSHCRDLGELVGPVAPWPNGPVIDDGRGCSRWPTGHRSKGSYQKPYLNKDKQTREALYEDMKQRGFI